MTAPYTDISTSRNPSGGHSADDALLVIENLSVGFPTEDGVVQAVRGVSYTLRPREVLCIVGESGSGKSVTSLAVMGLLPWDLRARLERDAPPTFEAPTGTQAAIDYEAEQGPTIAIRVQELFGLNTHPAVAHGKVPLVVELLSPAHRPVQVTRDLPGFWRGSYAGVRADLRGRYPRHPWPDDPANALPTRRAKPRGT